jgi:hypothetical protein
MHDCDVWEDFIPAFIDEEKQLTLDYFGNLRGFKGLLPGIEVFRQNRLSERQRRYTEFFGFWQQSVRKQIWKKMDARMQQILAVPEPITPENVEELQPSTAENFEGKTMEVSIDNEEGMKNENRSDQ